MNVNRIINGASYAGKIMLENGAEVYRVEETIERICNSYGVKNVDTFVTLSVIIVSNVDCENKTTSIVKRIKKRTLNLEKISSVNHLSRHLHENLLDIESMEKELRDIENIEPYSTKTNIFFAGIMAAFFSLLFGGDIKDFFVSFIIGCLIKVVSTVLNTVKTNEFFINIICSMMTALIAVTTSYLGFTHSDKVIIGSIMLLVPGLAITNAIRDTINGDLIAGMSRGLEAFLIAVAIAVGTGIVLRFWIVLFGGV